MQTTTCTLIVNTAILGKIQFSVHFKQCILQWNMVEASQQYAILGNPKTWNPESGMQYELKKTSSSNIKKQEYYIILHSLFQHPERTDTCVPVNVSEKRTHTEIF